jgi:AcrR family transcriptional regulator
MTDRSDISSRHVPHLGRPPRWKREPETRPQQILEAAFHVFGTRGLHKATLEEVARAAGISKGTIYLYFPSKAALFSAMLRARVHHLMPAFDAAGDRPNGRGQQQLALLARRLHRFFQSAAFLTMYRTVVGEAAAFPEAASSLYRDGVLPANRRLAELLRVGMERGEFRRLDPLIAARAFVGMFQIFAISQGLLGGRRIYPMPEAHILKTVTDLFFHGLLAPGRRAPRARDAR